jgi:hypothetical protein
MRKWKPFGSRRDPSIYTAISNLYPTARGSYRAGPLFTGRGSAGAGPATPGTTLSAWVGVGPNALGGYVGTTTKVYSIDVIGTGSFTDRSSGAYATSAAHCFAHYGNICIKADLANNTEFRDSSGVSNFAALAGAPKAKFVVVQSNVVLLLNINDGTAKQDGYYTSDVGDYTNWTTLEASNNRILGRAGALTAAIAFRDRVLVFKQNSMWWLTYVGSPSYWRVDLISDAHGVAFPGQVANCGDFVVFIGPNGAYIFDGASFKDIGRRNGRPSI